jgi:hypothetical protein
MNWAKATSAISGVVAAISTLLAVAGYASPEQISQLQQAVAAIVSAVSTIVAIVVPLIHGRFARAQVTPTVAPVSHTGVPLRTAAEWAADEYGRHAATPKPGPIPAAPPDAGPAGARPAVDSKDVPMPAPLTFRPGRLPNDPSKPRVRLSALEAPAAAYDPPAAVRWYAKVDSTTWGVDGNDRVGDCTFAEVDHAVKMLQVAAGNPEVVSSEGEILADYAQVTGYDPSQTQLDGSNPTDQGAVMQDVRNYWRTNGVTLGGNPHKILLFTQVDHTDRNLVKWCISRFGELGLGFAFPRSAMDQFNSGQPWTVVPGSPIDGGHAVAGVGYDDQFVYVVTWGQVQAMSWSFFDAYVDEAWTQLSEEFVNSVSGDDPLSETLYGLGEQYAAVTGQPNPVPAPTPTPIPVPEPAPVPTPAPSPAPMPSPSPAPSPSPQPAPPAPEPAPVGFPVAEWDAFEYAMNNWLDSGGGC